MRLVTLFFGLQLVALGASANFDAAMKLYQNKDYEHAFFAFNRMAEIGDHASQFNVGIMHFRGESVQRDSIVAYSWMALASQKGDENWAKMRDKLFASLSEGEKAKAVSVRETLFSRLSDAVLEKQMAPEVISRGSATSVKLKKSVAPKYPQGVRDRGEDGWVDIAFTVVADGTTRNHSIISATDLEFTTSALKSLKQWRFEPRVVRNTAVAQYGVIHRVLFRIADTEYRQQSIEKLAQELRNKAENGNPAELYEYASTLQRLASLSGVDLTKYKVDRWFNRAAEAGYGPAQFALAQGMFYASDLACKGEPEVALKWLLRAAKGGQTDAQNLLAYELLSGVRLRQNVTAAIKLLERASMGNNLSARLQLAWIFATTPDDNLRNSKAAKYYVDMVPDNYLDHLTLFEVRAAVVAANDNFSDAVLWQNKALDEASRYDLPKDTVSDRLKAYQAQKSWTEPATTPPPIADEKPANCLPVGAKGHCATNSEECRALEQVNSAQ